MMEIIETSIFTRQVQQLLTQDEYRLLQIALLQHPESGDVIPQSGGLRKKRWTLHGKGKRGGTRIIYYWAVSRNQLLMLMIYAKNELDDLTAGQLKILARIIQEEYHER
jgi:mRNA-degrading endonuclease RelE of RelBE toxin-antitoxin system